MESHTIIDYSSLEYGSLIDIGVSIQITLDTNPITLLEANALMEFLTIAVHESIFACSEGDGEPAIVPIIQLQDGSLIAIIKFFQSGAKKAKSITLEQSRAVAQNVASIIIASMITGALPHGLQNDHDLQARMQECSKTIVRPQFEKLTRTLEESGKAFSIEVGECRIVVEGNQGPREKRSSSSIQSTNPKGTGKHFEM